jgi:hypothetical protein
MLDQLKNDFELILFSAQPKDYTMDVAKHITLVPPIPNNPPTPEKDAKKAASKGAVKMT